MDYFLILAMIGWDMSSSMSSLSLAILSPPMAPVFMSGHEKTQDKHRQDCLSITWSGEIHEHYQKHEYILSLPGSSNP